MPRLLTLLLSLWAMLQSANDVAAQVRKVQSSEVTFESTAPQEEIQAKSTALKGVLDVDTRLFAMKVEILSFMGFNSPLQREHFNENYMESNKYPFAIFTGKIIESAPIQKDGVYEVRAKGKLLIHGVSQERIIPLVLTVKGNTLQVDASFHVGLDEHKIKIPRLVNQKLSDDIHVRVHANLIPQ